VDSAGACDRRRRLRGWRRLADGVEVQERTHDVAWRAAKGGARRKAEGKADGGAWWMASRCGIEDGVDEGGAGWRGWRRTGLYWEGRGRR
jgi:hypothetical protein